jgi:hypothetical protein
VLPLYIVRKNDSFQMLGVYWDAIRKNAKKPKLYHFKVGLMREVKVGTKISADQIRTLEKKKLTTQNGFNLTSYLDKHLFLYGDEKSGRVTTAKVKVPANHNGYKSIYESFGSAATLKGLFDKDDKITKIESNASYAIFEVEGNKLALEIWARQNLDTVEVLGPKELRNNIAESLKKGTDKYPLEEK